jgi:antitoxin component of RelBE/YafQ-DinJ toxin-antitoxin module
MTSQVIFKIDKKIKDQAMKKAQGEGIAFSSVLKLATQAYIGGSLNVRLVAEPKVNAETRKILARELLEIKQEKNVSPRFGNARDAVDFLKNL